MVKQYLFFLILVVLTSLGGCKSSDEHGYFAQLDEEIMKKEEYDKAKEERIKQIKNILSHSIDDELTQDLLWQLITEYRNYQSDSAEAYSIKLIDFGSEIGSKEAENLGFIGLMDNYTAVGYFKEASDVQEMISEDVLTPQIRLFYLDLAYRLYENLESYVFSSGSNLKDIYREQRVEFLSELLDSTLPETYEREAAEIELDQLKGSDLQNIIVRRKELLDKYKLNPEQQSRQYYKLGQILKEIGKTGEAKEYFALGAVTDLQNSNKEGLAEANLIRMLLNEGETSKASKYIKDIKDNADFYGSQLRKVETGVSLPLNNDIENLNKKRSRNFVIFLILTIVFVVLAGWLAWELRKKDRLLKESRSMFNLSNKELTARNEQLAALHDEIDRTQHQLKETRELKDDYLRQSLFVNTEFINKVESKVKNIEEKIKEKKYNELKVLENQFGIKDERQRILRDFDRSFQRIFPNFITEMNKMFPPEHKIVIEDNEELPMEVRIFALTRLGINDPSEIAEYLNLTVKTVYVYKTKLKSKSLVENNEFEEKIMLIPKL